MLAFREGAKNSEMSVQTPGGTQRFFHLLFVLFAKNSCDPCGLLVIEGGEQTFAAGGRNGS